MNVHVYTFCRDEALLLPFFLEHYAFANQITVFFDVHTVDNSRALIESNPNCRIIEFDFGGKYRDDFLMYAKNSEWKMSKNKADWVIIADMDEFLYHPNSLENYLEHCQALGISIPLTKGYEMFSDKLPSMDSPITAQIKTGVASKNFDKKVIFNPAMVENIFYRPGSHNCDPTGVVTYSDKQELLLLHYKYIGGPDRISQRWNTFGSNLSQVNIENNWSIKRLDPQEAIKRYNKIKNDAAAVIS